MPRVAPRVPELSEILCASCGYVLDGLNQAGQCPECGKPIIESIGQDRVPPAWEAADDSHRAKAFIQTSSEIIFRTKNFYRTLNVRGSLESARRFAKWHWWIASLFFGIAGATHAVWFNYTISNYAIIQNAINFPGGGVVEFAIFVLGLTLASYAALDGVTRLAGRLTNWEATYRGYRLPYSIVLRGLYYHAAHYFPVGIAAVILVDGYQLLRVILGDRLPFNSPMIYLYTLAALVVLSAIYLFQTYWIGMRNMMFANR
jgi:hypothetical protein